MQEELRRLAEEARATKAKEAGKCADETEEEEEVPKVVELDENGEELTKHNPQTR